MQSFLEELVLGCSLQTTFDICKDKGKEKREKPKLTELTIHRTNRVNSRFNDVMMCEGR